MTGIWTFKMDATDQLKFFFQRHSSIPMLKMTPASLFLVTILGDHHFFQPFQNLELVSLEDLQVAARTVAN